MITLEDLWYGNINPHERFLEDKKVEGATPHHGKGQRKTLSRTFAGANRMA